MFTAKGYTLVPTPEEADIIVFTGGEDIHPSLYGQDNVASYVGFAPSRRDTYEQEVFNSFKEKPKFGICRGAQLLTALSGGSLWQDLSHNGQHELTDVRTGRKLTASSIHHQMIRPGETGQVVATHTTKSHRVDATSSKVSVEADAEIIWFFGTNSLCVQGHPEVGPNEFTDYCFDLINEFFSKETSSCAA